MRRFLAALICFAAVAGQASAGALRGPPIAATPASSHAPTTTSATAISTTAPSASMPTSAAAAGDESTRDSILRHLARPAPSTTPFIEARFSPLLSRPLIVSGELQYLGPGTLVRIVRKPYRERAQIRGDTVTVQRGGEPQQQFSLDRVPQMRSLVGSFSALLSGDVAALRSAFALDLHGSGRGWTIGLTPLDPRVHQRIRSILVTGSGSVLRCLTTFQANGDTDVTLLTRVAQASVPATPDRAWFDVKCRGMAGSAPAGQIR